MDKITNKFSYQLVDQGSYETVLGWLQKPHINEFFHGQGLQNTLKDLEEQISSDSPQYQHWIAIHDETPFGYLITSYVKPQDKEDNRFAQYMKSEEIAITLDLFIGEERYLGKGLSSIMIQSFLLDKFSHITSVFIDPEVANTKAIHVYEKVGFKKLMQFIAEWHPVPHWLMKIEMCDLRQTDLKEENRLKEISVTFDLDFFLTVDDDLLLRVPKIKDAPDLFQLMDSNRIYLRRFLGWLDRNQIEADTEAFIHKEHEQLQCGKSITLAIWYDQNLVGLVDLHDINKTSHSASIGYWLDESHQSKGIMTRSVKALVEYGFNTMNLHRIEIRCSVENKKSAQIPIALGFKKEGTLRDAEYLYGKYCDIYLFGFLSTDRK